MLGLGEMTAYSQIKKHKDIETLLDNIHIENMAKKSSKIYSIPDNFNYIDVR